MAFLDDQLNTVDTQGDEGALFSAELLGIELSDAEKSAIQAENDSITITVDDINIDAEVSQFFVGVYAFSVGYLSNEDSRILMQTFNHITSTNGELSFDNLLWSSFFG